MRGILAVAILIILICRSEGNPVTKDTDECDKCKTRHHGDASEIEITINNNLNNPDSNGNAAEGSYYSCISMNTGCAYRAVSNNAHIGQKGFCSIGSLLQNSYTTSSYCDKSSEIPCFLTDVELRICKAHSMCQGRHKVCSPLCYNCDLDTVGSTPTPYATTATAKTGTTGWIAATTAPITAGTTAMMATATMATTAPTVWGVTSATTPTPTITTTQISTPIVG